MKWITKQFIKSDISTMKSTPGNLTILLSGNITGRLEGRQQQREESHRDDDLDGQHDDILKEAGGHTINKALAVKHIAPVSTHTDIDDQIDTQAAAYPNDIILRLLLPRQPASAQSKPQGASNSK